MVAERQIDIDRKARAAERRHVQIAVKVRRPGETWFVSRITDVSVTGFRLQSFMKLTVGSDIWVMLPGFEGRRARITWTRAHESGCAFERPLHPAILDHVIRLSLAASTAG
ncbi:PilZ domain-containing protein [Sphingobium sp. CAP-1]|uniref:PilZ domain-containing protein n=1 Tax=Sphingobium sp. CAP-1 TaxID=2676077 RepID=UPI0012BB286C|nr:PilZ domain-containing protein [Sphingobium sp. CAP-1]QGP79253.1 PilZ domain-containing protein [Sphingobium sp. CAP-1]